MATFKVCYAVVNMELSDVVEAVDESAAIAVIRKCALKIDAIRSIERIADASEIMVEESERRTMDALISATGSKWSVIDSDGNKYFSGTELDCAAYCGRTGVAFNKVAAMQQFVRCHA